MRDTLKMIVEALREEESGFLPFQELHERTGLSGRYAKMIVEESAEECRINGFEIKISFRKGYTLRIMDQALFESALEDRGFMKNRAIELLRYLLEHPDWAKTDDLADYFYHSRATMNRVLLEVRALAEAYELTIVSRPKYGIRVEGKEINKRVCLAHCNINTASPDPNVVQNIQEILFSTLKDHRYEMSDTNFNNLVYHILILLRRLREGIDLPEPFALKKSYEQQVAIATDLAGRIQERFQVTIPEQEINYLVLHLLGKQTIQSNLEISQQVFDLADEIFVAIDREQGTRFGSDLDFKVNFCLHLQPLLVRLKYHFKQINPLLGQAKREMARGYEMAMIAKLVIREKCGLELNDHEAGYLAVYFSLELEKGAETQLPLKFLVVCSTGRGISQLLQYKLMAQYSLSEENVILSSLVQLKDRPLEEYSCIITTVPIPFHVPIPVVQINPILNETGVSKIDAFIKNYHQGGVEEQDNPLRDARIFQQTHLRSQEEALRILAQNFGEGESESEALYQALTQREKLSSTEVGNQCCLAHPMGWFPEKLMVGVLFLDKPIRWKNEKVKFVFFMAAPKEYADRAKVGDALIKLICDKRRLGRLEQNPTPAGLWEVCQA